MLVKVTYQKMRNWIKVSRWTLAVSSTALEISHHSYVKMEKYKRCYYEYWTKKTPIKVYFFNINFHAELIEFKLVKKAHPRAQPESNVGVIVE